MKALHLAVVLSVVFAGCVGGPGGGTDSADPTTPDGSATATTPSSTACAVEERPDPDPEGNAVNATTYPETPSTFSNESVTAYVESFEAAYLRNEALAGPQNVTYLEVYVPSIEVTNVTESGAFVVHVTSYTNGGYLAAGESGTPVVVHWDGAPKRVSYLVSETEVRRARGSVGEDWPSLETLRHSPSVACPSN